MPFFARRPLKCVTLKPPMAFVLGGIFTTEGSSDVKKLLIDLDYQVNNDCSKSDLVNYAYDKQVGIL